MSEEELFSKINIALTRINNSTSIKNETYIDKEVLQELLNYIDKQQKEIEQEKEKNKLLKTEVENFDEASDLFIKDNCVYKQDIRDKIKELEEDREKVRNIYEPSDDDSEFIQTYQILVLQELLEEE